MKIHVLIFIMYVFFASSTNANLAFDSSNNYTNGVWNNGDNQGIGLRNWELTQNPNSGFYIGGTGAGNSTFGLYANEFSFSRKEFEQVLNIGQSFQITLGHTANITAQLATLFSASADLINLSFSSGESNWLLWDGDPSTYSSAAYNPNTPLLFSFSRNDSNEYTYTFAEVTETRNAISDITQIIGFRIYNSGQGAGKILDSIISLLFRNQLPLLISDFMPIDFKFKRMKRRENLMKEFISDEVSLGNLEKSHLSIRILIFKK